jgi:hypothetical protein
VTARRSTTYVSAVKVVKHAPGSFTVYADPIPMHAAHVYQRGRHGVWVVEFHTVTPVRTWHKSTEKDALVAAGDVVSRVTGREWKDRFNGLQRYAMGQQKCPRMMSSGTCDQAAQPGTIWCEWHPGGKERADG